jgi:transcription initiation factor TFIIIB Brf1 subunit/transcription initiation factor TFIIB
MLGKERTIIYDQEECRHLNVIRDQKEGSEVCVDCALVVNNRICESCEWNNYKSEDGTFGTSSQRADLYVSDNPYEKGGSVPGFYKNSFMMRMHLQQTFSHKQKTFWKISEKFNHYISVIGIHQSVLPTAKDMWHICMESGKLTRASVRNGLISACLYYACIHNNLPVARQKVIDNTEGNQKGFLKGEKIYLEIMETNKFYNYLGKQKIDIKGNDTFVKFCSALELPFKNVHICNEIYTECLDKLDSVTPKSITAGILFFVVKHKLKLKQPSKAKISQVVNVCIPTINKVVSILETIYLD